MSTLVVGVFLVGVLTAGSGSGSGGARIVRHESSGIVDLVPGAARGSFTMPLHQGLIGEQTVYFVIADASDKDFAEEFGTIRADSLDEAPAAAVESATFIDGVWTFQEDPGLVARFVSGNAVGPVANPDYSPLKRFMWDGELVTANLPIIKWGDGPGQKLITDHGGCNPLFRSNPPSPFFVGDGPRDGGEGATPMAGSGIPRFDPADPATFDPFGMDDKAVDCAEFARQVTGNSDGFIESLGHLDDLIADGHAIQTEGPPGLRLDSTLQPPLMVNCPVPLTVRL